MCANPLGNLVRRTVCCCMQSGQETLGKCFAAVGQFAERCAAIGTRKYTSSFINCATWNFALTVTHFFLAEYEQQCSDSGHPDNICGVLEEQACVHGRCVPLPEQFSFSCECDQGYHTSVDKQRCIGKPRCNNTEVYHFEINVFYF